MNLGDILGSISPAYGVATGDGLGGMLRYLSPAFLMVKGLGGDSGDDPSGQAPQPNALGRLGEAMQQNPGFRSGAVMQPMSPLAPNHNAAQLIQMILGGIGGVRP